MAFHRGDHVHSRSVGVRDAFNGKVIEVHEAIKDYAESYDVVDAEGRAWNRSANDLTRL